jgi:hypothetical protein
MYYISYIRLYYLIKDYMVQAAWNIDLILFKQLQVIQDDQRWTFGN